MKYQYITLLADDELQPKRGDYSISSSREKKEIVIKLSISIFFKSRSLENHADFIDNANKYNNIADWNSEHFEFI